MELAVADRLAERVDRGLVPAEVQVAPRRDDVRRLDLRGAGSTMSAYAAASVMNCSWTTVKRSSRDRPRRIASTFGVITIGLQFHTISEFTGGSSVSSVRIEPRRLMFSERGGSPAGGDGPAVPRRRRATPTTHRCCAPGRRHGPATHRRAQGGTRACGKHRPVLVVLGADERADRRGPDRAVVVGQSSISSASMPQIAAARGCPLRDVLGELVEAVRVRVEPLVVDEVVTDEDVDHRQQQRDVGAGGVAARTGRRPPRGQVRIGSITTTRAPSARAASIVGQR